MIKKIAALKSTILGLALTVGIGLGVAYDKLDKEFLIAMVPTIYLVFSDVFKEKKNEE